MTRKRMSEQQTNDVLDALERGDLDEAERLLESAGVPAPAPLDPDGDFLSWFPDEGQSDA